MKQFYESKPWIMENRVNPASDVPRIPDAFITLPHRSNCTNFEENLSPASGHGKVGLLASLDQPNVLHTEIPPWLINPSFLSHSYHTATDVLPYCTTRIEQQYGEENERTNVEHLRPLNHQNYGALSAVESVENLTPREHRRREPSKRLSRGDLRRKRVEEARAIGAKPLTKSERRRAWKEKHATQAQAPGKAGFSGTQAPGVLPVQGSTSKATPDTSDRTSRPGVKRPRSQLTPEETGAVKKRPKTWQDAKGTKRPSESYAHRTSVEKMAVVRFDHPDVKLTEAESSRIKGELSRRAFRSEGVRMSSCHLECGAVVVGCVNTTTKEWLEKQIQELSPVMGLQLKMGPAHIHVKMVKVNTFVPKTIGAEGKRDVMLGLKRQSGLNTDNWVIVGGRTTYDGQYLVILIDEDSLQKLKTFGLRPFLGCERITFRVQGAKDHLQ